MRLSRTILACLLGMAASPVLAASFETPQALLKAMYSDRVGSADPDSLTPYQDYFSDHLNGLFKADAAKTQPGDSLSLDSIPSLPARTGRRST